MIFVSVSTVHEDIANILTFAWSTVSHELLCLTCESVARSQDVPIPASVVLVAALTSRQTEQNDRHADDDLHP